MPPKTYSEEDRAAVYVVLVTNEWNVKRTARETGIPEQTVRRWKNDFIENGPPNTENLEEALGDFLEEAEKVRWKAIRVLDHKIKDAKPSELITVIGVLDDKISRARGLALNRVEHVHALPSPEEMAAQLRAAMQGVLEAATRRQEEIIDAEVVLELPAASS